MLDNYWKSFKSGSDIRGTAIEEKAGDKTYLSDDVIERIIYGFVQWMRKGITDEVPLCVSVGHDTRISSPKIKNIVIKALIRMGISVKDCGYSSTPAMFMSIINLPCNGAIEITASHHPYDKNGLKFFTRFGGLNSSDIDEILELAQENKFIFAREFGAVEEVNNMNIYSKNLREMICKEINAVDYSRPLRDFKIIVDAGNGIGGFYAEKVLAPLGADIEGSQFLEYDGTFPNHMPNPEDAKAMDSLQNAVISNEADIGIIFDTDVDRAACVDKDGAEINKNKLIALASAIALENNEGGTIVTDSITSDGLKEFIEKVLGGKHLRYKRGYRNVIDKQMELNDNGVNSPLAIECSGHAAFRDNYYLDDGAYLVTKIIIKMAQLGKEGKKITDLIKDLKEPKETLSVKLPILKEDYREYGETVLEKINEILAEQTGWTVANDSFEGVRVSANEMAGNGFFVLRISVHDPAMPLDIQSDDIGGTLIMAEKLNNILSTFEYLDLTPFRELTKH